MDLVETVRSYKFRRDQKKEIGFDVQSSTMEMAIRGSIRPAQR